MKNWKGFLIIGLLILGIGGFIYYKMPYENCWEEKSIRSMEFKGICVNELDFLCMHDYYILEDNEIAICEDGIYEFYGLLIKYNGREEKTCLIESVEVKCEVMYR